MRSFRAMTGLDYVALRYFNVYGPRMDVHGLYTEVLVRWMERIADGQPPLIFGDGRRRWTSSSPSTSPGPTSWLPQSDVREGVYNIASGDGDEPARAGRGPAAGHGLRPGGRARARAGGERRDPTRSPTAAAARADLGLERRRSGSRRDCASSSTWWRPQREAVGRPGDAPGRRMSRDQRHAAVAGCGGGRRRHRGHRVRLGGPGPQGRGVRDGLRRSGCRLPHAVAVSSCTTGAAPGAGRRRGRRRATTSWCRRSRSSPRPTPPPTSAPDRCSPTSTRRRATSPPTRVKCRPHPAYPGGHRRRPGRRTGRPRAPSASSCDPLGHRRHRGRRVRRGIDVRRGGRSAPTAEITAWSVPPAQDRHHR